MTGFMSTNRGGFSISRQGRKMWRNKCPRAYYCVGNHSEKYTIEEYIRRVEHTTKVGWQGGPSFIKQNKVVDDSRDRLIEKREYKGILAI